MRKKSAHAPNRYNFFVNIFNLWLIECEDLEPPDMDGQLYFIYSPSSFFVVHLPMTMSAS
jgi:hypothetical protein